MINYVNFTLVNIHNSTVYLLFLHNFPSLNLVMNCYVITADQSMFLSDRWFFMEPSDYYDAPINKVIHFIRGVGLKKG
jgi:hypothetical protein